MKKTYPHTIGSERKITEGPGMTHFTRVAYLLTAFAFGFVCLLSPAEAQITVTASGPAGSASQTADAQGRFDLKLPLSKNSVNTITVTATDVSGNKVSQDIKVTQLSLDQIVVSQVTAETLSVEEIKQLVSDGVIDIEDPENYNVSKFDLVLTIADKPVPIHIAVPTRIAEPDTGYEVYRMPEGEGSGGGKPQTIPPEIVVFDQAVAPTEEMPNPPRIPGVIIIEGNIKSLKEFYTVRLLLMNTSGIFTLKNIVSSISFPDGGLSPTAPADGIIHFGDILPGDGGVPGQAERQFIIRGDEIGIRHVRVSFGGNVAGPGISEDKPIPFNGSAVAQVEVKGPPTFNVKVMHPDSVEKNIPYDLEVEITNTGDVPALYASLSLDVGADAELVRCENSTGNPVCTEIAGPDIRSFGDILAGQTVSATFAINPLKTGAITSCVGISDQNIALQVAVGNSGCLVGRIAPERGVPDGVPTVNVAPSANMQGVSIDTPVTAFFSQQMDESTITTGSGGTFNVFDKANNIVPGVLRFTSVNEKTVAIWQVLDNITNRLAPNTEYAVYITTEASSISGRSLYNAWTSRFTTTGTDLDDTIPPTLALGVEPPVNASYVLPGQKVIVTAYAADQGSGIVRVELRSKDISIDGSAYQLVDRKVVFSGDKPPFAFTIDSANLIPGHIYQLLATAYDYMMNGQNATLHLIIAESAAAPTITLPDNPEDPVLQGISVTLTPLAITGGVTEVRYYIDDENASTAPFKTVNLSPYQASLGTLKLGLGQHRITAVAVDGLGQTGKATYLFDIGENRNAPQISLSGLIHGASYIVGSSFVVSGKAADPVGIASIAYFLDDASTDPLATGAASFSISTGGLDTGMHSIITRAVNNLGVSSTLTTAFNVVEKPNGPAPNAPSDIAISIPADGKVAVTGTAVASGARVDISNTSLGITATVYAAINGVFSAVLPGSSGDEIRIVNYDFNQSQSPSEPVVGSVPVPAALEYITLEPAAVVFNKANAYADIAVTGHYDDGSSVALTSKAAFSSSKPAVATVNGAGRIAAIGNGNASITVSVPGAEAGIVAVTVNIVTLTSVTVDPSPVDFSYIDQTQQLTVTAHYSDDSTRILTSGVSFVTGDVAVAAVAAGGMVTATGNGNTQITASYPGLVPAVVPISVAISDEPPTVAILSPSDGAAVERGDLVSVYVRGRSTSGGVDQISLQASGQTGYSAIEMISPAASDTTREFSFSVSPTAAIGETISIGAQAKDTSGRVANIAVTLHVTDQTAPAVSITEPSSQTRYNYGDTVRLSISATDIVGVARIRYETTGAFVCSDYADFSGAGQSETAAFSFVVPSNLPGPDVQIMAYAVDAAGNERASVAVKLHITSADITASSSYVTSVEVNGASAVVTYQVNSGLDDLDHVELYFRRDGIGRFIRYTDADGGNPEGMYKPQSNGAGSLIFDSTKMGGDGTYDFYTVAVDIAGNREEAPSPASPADFAGLLAYYPFSGNAADVSGNGNDGMATGASLASDRFGQENQAYSFSYGNHISLPSGMVPTASSSYTLGCWIKYTSANGSMMAVSIEGTYVLYINRFKTGAFTPMFDGSSLNGDLSYGSNLNNGRWHHIVGVHDNGTLFVYIDGYLAGTATEALSNLSSQNLASTIGSQYDASGNFYVGAIDDVIFYNRALSANEIRSIYSLMPDHTATFTAGTIWTTITSNAAAGIGDTTYDNQNIRVIGKTFTVDGTHSFHNIELMDGAVLTHSETDTAVSYGLDIHAWTLTIDNSSAINVDARGYLGGAHNGNGATGRTMGNVGGAAGQSGGSYGGLGGVFGGGPTNVAYGSLTDPGELGSGGSVGCSSGYRGGDGGGWVAINATNIVLNGALSANGESGYGCQAGSGSGGTINIRTSTLSGTGTISANGGAGEVGGGGGRIAIRTVNASGIDITGIQASRGTGNNRSGENGTVYIPGILE